MSATMQGRVKTYSEAKRQGFITGDNATDYFFNINEVQGIELPHEGDRVCFLPAANDKGPLATAVVIKERNPVYVQQGMDNKMTCPHCHERMVPKVIFEKGNAVRSVCSGCGGQIKDFDAGSKVVTWVLVTVLCLFLFVRVVVIGIN